jgi:hypothetical protein
MNESLLKTDRIGRLRHTPEQKKTMVDAYRASGLSAPRFAAHHGRSEELGMLMDCIAAALYELR